MPSGVVAKILEYISIFLALLVVLSLHEFAHAFAAVKSGDITPKIKKRYTINPLAHFDLIGLAAFLFVGFGWSKPVPVNPNNFKNYKLGCFFVTVSGVAVNLLTSFLIFPLCILSTRLPQFGYFTYVLQDTLWNVFWFGITFSVFNLIPLFPLDGFRLIELLTKSRNKIYYFLRNYGSYILYALFLFSLLSELLNVRQLDVLGWYIGHVSSYVAVPTIKFWGLIF